MEKYLNKFDKLGKMEFGQPIGESLTPTMNLAHRLQDDGANIAIITNALMRAGFSEKVQTTVRIVIDSESKAGYKPTIKYQQQPPYSSRQDP